MTNHFRYKQQDIKVLARKRRNMSMYSPIGALICSSAHDRDYLFNAADHERFALDALANYPGAIKTLTKTRMEEHIRAGGGFQNRTMVAQWARSCDFGHVEERTGNTALDRASVGCLTA